LAWAIHKFNSIQDGQLSNLVFKHKEGNLLIIGLSYKPGVSIEEESAGFLLYESLKHLGNVRAYDELLVPGRFNENVDWANTVVIATRRPPEMNLAGKIVIDCWGQYEGDCDKHIVLGVGL
jgi:hypothetical protein